MQASACERCRPAESRAAARLLQQPRAACARPGGARARRDVTRAVGWDPENVLAGPQEGHIARRAYQKKVMKDAAFLQQARHGGGASAVRLTRGRQEERRLAKEQTELEAKRDSRLVPVGNPKAMVEFLLNTAAAEMPFEIARCRPQLARETLAGSRAC